MDKFNNGEVLIEYFKERAASKGVTLGETELKYLLHISEEIIIHRNPKYTDCEMSSELILQNFEEWRTNNET